MNSFRFVEVAEDGFRRAFGTGSLRQNTVASADLPGRDIEIVDENGEVLVRVEYLAGVDSSQMSERVLGVLAPLYTRAYATHAVKPNAHPSDAAKAAFRRTVQDFWPAEGPQHARASLEMFRTKAVALGIPCLLAWAFLKADELALSRLLSLSEAEARAIVTSDAKSYAESGVEARAIDAAERAKDEALVQQAAMVAEVKHVQGSQPETLTDAERERFTVEMSPVAVMRNTIPGWVERAVRSIAMTPAGVDLGRFPRSAGGGHQMSISLASVANAAPNADVDMGGVEVLPEENIRVGTVAQCQATTIACAPEMVPYYFQTMRRPVAATVGKHDERDVIGRAHIEQARAILAATGWLDAIVGGEHNLIPITLAIYTQGCTVAGDIAEDDVGEALADRWEASFEHARTAWDANQDYFAEQARKGERSSHAYAPFPAPAVPSAFLPKSLAALVPTLRGYFAPDELYRHNPTVFERITASFRGADPYQAPIAKFLAEHKQAPDAYVTSAELIGLLGDGSDAGTKRQKKVMGKLGWVKKRIIRDGNRFFAFVRAEAVEATEEPATATAQAPMHVIDRDPRTGRSVSDLASWGK